MSCLNEICIESEIQTLQSMLNISLNFPGKEIKVFFSFTQAGDLNGNSKPSIGIYSDVSKTKQIFWKYYNAHVQKLKVYEKLARKTGRLQIMIGFKFGVNSLTGLST